MLFEAKKINIASKEYGIKMSKADAGKLSLALIFIAIIILPLTRMVLYINNKSIMLVVNSAMFGRALLNSFIVSLISSIVTLFIGFMLAWCIQRTRIRLKGIFSIIFVLPMLIPSISHGMGIIILFGNNGIISNLLKFDSGIYGMKGIIAGSVLYAFPVAFLMFNDVMKYEDGLPYEAARVLGIPRWHQIISITIPYLRKPLISIVFAIFTLIITDYGIPLTVGGKYTTIPVLMYQEVIGQLNFGKGSVYGSILLIPALIAFIFDVTNKDKGNSSFVVQNFVVPRSKIRDAFSYVICILVSLIIMLPLFSFVVLSFVNKYPTDMTLTLANIIRTINMGGDRYLKNSLLISILVSIIGVTIAFITAYMTARMKSKLSNFLHLVTITSLAIPGLVLGLSYVLMFKTSFIYGTMMILILVNLAHFIASPYLMIYNSFNKFNENLESVGHILGISRAHMIKDVFLPLSKTTIIEMFSYFFVNCMMTISAVSFLATTSNKPISLMINQFEAQMQLECAAVVSLAILILNTAVKVTAFLIKRLSKLRLG